MSFLETLFWSLIMLALNMLIAAIGFLLWISTQAPNYQPIVFQNI